MSKKIDGKKGKINNVKASQQMDSVDKATGVEDVGKIEKTSTISRVSGAGKAGGSQGLQITSANKEKIYQMIAEESEKLFGKNPKTKEQKAIVEQAVKMAIETALPEEEEEKDKK